MRPMTKFSAASAAAALAIASLAACSSGSSGSPSAGATSEDAPVTITVGDKPTADQPKSLANFERKLAAFEAANPNIKIEAQETLWDAQTFQALVAGGQLPTVMNAPFTEIQGLIERQQVLDVTDLIAEDSSIRDLNPSVVDVVTGQDDHLYGVPVAAYSMGLIYNRALFEAAGLDPDSPPTTWDEVREAAKAIEDKTDAQGFLAMTSDNTGGWVLTTTSYGFGERIQSEDGTEATIDNAATAAVLDLYHAMRWDDNTMGSNFIVNWGDSMNSFAAGQVGMFVQGADAYNQVVVNLGMDQNDFGLAPLPQADNGIGTLGGGSAAVFSPKATPEEAEAALKWTEFYYLSTFTDEEVAVENAAAKVADGAAVGAPGLPLFDQATMDQYFEWIADYINVPRENYALYLSTADTLPLVTEPSAKAQETYALLDTVVQAVLTREDADIPTLLSDAQVQAQAVIDAG